MNQRLIIMQIILALAALAFCHYKFGAGAWLAAFYGGAVAVLNTWWLNRGVKSAGVMAETDPKQGVYMLYFGAVQRFVFVLVALGIGLAALKLRPEPLLITFGVAQLAYFLGGKAR